MVLLICQHPNHSPFIDKQFPVGYHAICSFHCGKTSTIFFESFKFYTPGEFLRNNSVMNSNMTIDNGQPWSMEFRHAEMF